jgi:hypothetical protein
MDSHNAWPQDSPYYNEFEKAGLFYAQSWALVHMMNLAPEYRRSMPQFVDLVGAGAPAELAFEKAFSRNLEQGLDDAARWIRQPRMPVLSLVWRPPSAVEIEAEPLREDEAEVAQIELLLRVGRHAAAENRLRRLERTFQVPPVVSAWQCLRWVQETNKKH